MSVSLPGPRRCRRAAAAGTRKWGAAAVPGPPITGPIASLCDRRRGGRAAGGAERAGRRRRRRGGSWQGAAGRLLPHGVPLSPRGRDRAPPHHLPRYGSILWPRREGGGREEAETGARLPCGRVRRGPGRGRRCRAGGAPGTPPPPHRPLRWRRSARPPSGRRHPWAAVSLPAGRARAA